MAVGMCSVRMVSRGQPGNVQSGIDAFTVQMNLDMDVRAGHTARLPDTADLLAGFNPVTDRNVEIRKVSVEAFTSVAMIHDDGIAPGRMTVIAR